MNQERLGGQHDMNASSHTLTSNPQKIHINKLDTEHVRKSESQVSGAEASAHVSDSIYNTIVRLVVHEAVFDFDLPFKIKGNRSSSGTGFFIDNKGHILTCSHVVQNASHVYVEIPNEGKRRYKASVLGICPCFDLAVVQIENYKNNI